MPEIDPETTLLDRLNSFNPDSYIQPRALALYSAAIARASAPDLNAGVSLCREHNIAREALYEIILQSYLFLGFPRMLEAAIHLDSVWPAGSDTINVNPPEDSEAHHWWQRGITLCREVYADAYEPLQKRVTAFAPDIFRWMILEGYGKVLSRPGLSIVERELSIVGFLQMENRPRQLHSHMRGALNVGAELETLRLVVEDIGPAAGNGYTEAKQILNRLEAA